MPSFVRLGAVQQRVLVFLLVAAAFGTAIFLIGVAAIVVLDLSRPGVVFGGITRGVVC